MFFITGFKMIQALNVVVVTTIDGDIMLIELYQLIISTNNFYYLLR